jgi:sporulation protein YlmC with PRC-barrel domain
VASEERLRELEDKYEGYTVYDNRGDKIGKVDDLFIDEADREEYIGVKMGFLGRKSTLIPMDIARVNEADKAIEVSESKDHVKDAPSFDDDEDITPEYEDRIRSHFGLQSQGFSGSRGSYGASSGAAGTEEGRGSDEGYSDQDSSDQGYSDRGESAQDERADSGSSGVDTEYGERTASSSGTTTGGAAGAATGAASRFERGGSTEGFSGSGGSTGEGATSGAPRTRQTEETETFEEGGRTKVRRRIIREEIIEEDADSPS